MYRMENSCVKISRLGMNFLTLGFAKTILLALQDIQ